MRGEPRCAVEVARSAHSILCTHRSCAQAVNSIEWHRMSILTAKGDVMVAERTSASKCETGCLGIRQSSVGSLRCHFVSQTCL